MKSLFPFLPPSRFMVGCGRCDDWFHGDCVGLSLSQAQQMGEEDKEYVCVRCCAEEDKKTDILDADILEDQAAVEAHSEEKTMECEKLGSLKHMVANDKNKSVDDTVKHKVKILKRVSFPESTFIISKALHGPKCDSKISLSGLLQCMLLFSHKNELNWSFGSSFAEK